MSKNPRPPAEILESIGSNAFRVRDAAEGITQCILNFQDYLSKLPGRVEARCWGDHPNNEGPEDEMSLNLKFHRSGKTWIISWGTYHPSQAPDDIRDWQPLSEAPLRIKIAGVEMFPHLLDAVETSQQELIAELAKACDKYHVFAATLKGPAAGMTPAQPDQVKLAESQTAVERANGALVAKAPPVAGQLKKPFYSGTPSLKDMPLVERLKRTSVPSVPKTEDGKGASK